MINSTQLLTLTTLTLLFAACGGTTEPEPTIAPSAPVAVVEKSASIDTPAKTVTRADSGANDKIILAQAEAPAAPAAQKYKAETHYVKLTTAQGTSSPPDVVEVAEVFWYGCPHCYSFDPVVNNWANNLPDKVNFIIR